MILPCIAKGLTHIMARMWLSTHSIRYFGVSKNKTITEFNSMITYAWM